MKKLTPIQLKWYLIDKIDDVKQSLKHSYNEIHNLKEELEILQTLLNEIEK